MTRDRLIKLVESMRTMIEKRILSLSRLPWGIRFVVVASDPRGQWVVVSSNVDGRDTQAILQTALTGADRRGRVIEVQGEELR